MFMHSNLCSSNYVSAVIVVDFLYCERDALLSRDFLSIERIYASSRIPRFVFRSTSLVLYLLNILSSV